MANLERIYFRFPVKGSAELHEWLDSLAPIVESEISRTLAELSRTGWLEQEEILVYLHYMYFYRFCLPALEAVAGRAPVLAQPAMPRFMLLGCLVGRFLDDLVDRDSGFWSSGQALYWYSHFLVRCERERLLIGCSEDDEAAWWKCLRCASITSQALYSQPAATRAMACPDSCPMPLDTYPKRIPYFFWLLERHSVEPNRLAWVKEYVSALFYNYDVDDAFNDILRNVATEPAYNLLRVGLDTEGRFKLRTRPAVEALRAANRRSHSLMLACRERGSEMGIELGVAMLDFELEQHK